MTDQNGTRWEQQTINANENEEDFEDQENNSAKLFERSRIKALADERETVQKKTFCKWVNSHLSRVGCKIQDLYVDLRDGKMLIKLLEVLSGERLPNPTKGKMRIHCLENVDKSLTFLNEQRVHLENMGAHDIVDGNPRLTLGLIWTIILRFQIQDITIEEKDSSEIKSAKDALLLWCQMKTAGYPNVNVRNFTTSWRDGLAFNALIHKHRPDLIDYNTLAKSNPTHNLNNAFNTAEEKLGLTRLLDAEDVNVDYPDEKSIMTYVVTYYHYFSKMKAESVQGRRVGKVINQCREYQDLITDYDTLTTDLLEWIRNMISLLNERKFANSLPGVQQQLAAFNTYRTVEKPVKFVEKGNLEVLLFTIQSKMRANNQKPYLPQEGKKLGDINRAWESLEKAEHERELSLREELIRQEKLELLASRFDRKAGMRETWLSENQRLVSQDNFGYDLAAVEAATKKHEAIETDITAYEERVQSVVGVAADLEEQNYHDIERINARKDNVLALWQLLLELLRSRRRRLELSHELQKTFQEMLYILDWMDEIKVRLQSEEYGKHLIGVDDLIQKHSLLESDINVIGNRVQTIAAEAQKYADTDFPDVEGYKPCDPQIVSDRISHMTAAFEELKQLSADRLVRLGESRKMWQFYADMADEEGWIKEKEQIMSSPDLGHDLTSVQLLLTKFKAIEDELNSRRAHLEDVLQVGRDLIDAGNFGSEQISSRIKDIDEQWKGLMGLANYRRQRLQDSLNFYQFFADAEDVETWITDTFRVVSSEDVGHDEASVQSLVKKHKNIMEEVTNYGDVIQQLHEQASELGEQDRDSSEVTDRLAIVDRKYGQLKEMAELRKQRLQDALALYTLFNEADGVEQWITEKEKLLHTMVATEDEEEVEILKARFDTFDSELKANADKVTTVGQLSRQLLNNDHPDSDKVIERQKELKEKWAQLEGVADDKRTTLMLAHDLNQWQTDCQETMTWIRDKAKLIESTDELGNDLGGVITLQRRLSGLERDLAAIQAKLDSLQTEAERLQEEKPEEAAIIRDKITQLTELWQDLKQMLKARDERLGTVSDLQNFLQNLDHFQQWLARTQTAIASEDIPDDLVEAQKTLLQHQQIKEEIDHYAPDYAKMKEYGDNLVEGQNDVQYMFLRERLKALDDDWIDLQKMWKQKQNIFLQSLHLNEFMRDVRQAEVLLSQQDSFLSKEKTPHTIEKAENVIKEHEAFITTLDANDEKINGVLNLGQTLIKDNNYNSDKIQQKVDSARERRDDNRQRAYEQLERLRDQLALLQFHQDCEELRDWLGEKVLAAQDETYRDAKNIHSKYMRHQAFESEIKSNKNRLEDINEKGNKLIQEKPELAKEVQPELDDLTEQWKQLEALTEDKGQRLFDSNKHVLYEQSCDDIDGWINEIESQIITEDVGHDLTTVSLLVQKQNILESQLKIKQNQVQELETQTGLLRELEPEKEEKIRAKKAIVEERFAKILIPLMQRREALDNAKKVRQFLQDIVDEKLWIKEKMRLATSTDYGNSLLSVQMLQKKNGSLQNEIDSHEVHLKRVIDEGLSLIENGHPQADNFQKGIDELNAGWEELLAAVEKRKNMLEQSEAAKQYFFDASEAESWMGEQELYLMNDDYGKDEFGTNRLLKKHDNTESLVDDYANTIRHLGDRCQRFINDGHPESDAIGVKQSGLDKLYACLKDMINDRRKKLNDFLKLYMLRREYQDLEQWINEREVVAGSHELGQDFEHITMLRDRFDDFANDTESVGKERVQAVTEVCNQLIQGGHSEAPIIAEYKDMISEIWTDLLELMQTRKEALRASWELFKFFNDCHEVLARIRDKELVIPDESIGKDAQSIAALQRRLAIFEHDLVKLGSQVQQIQEEAARIIVSYSGDKAREIQQNEMDVVNAWRNLQFRLEERKKNLADSGDVHRFFAMVRDLLTWMSDINRQMVTSDKPRDVSGVELLMNNHQGLKAEIDSRDENFTICVNLGRELLARKHERSNEVRDKLTQLGNQRGIMRQQWEERWDYLKLILEVYMFARDATVADAWLATHEPLVHSKDVGETLAALEILVKKHDAFEKTLSTQEERFIALENLTTMELNALQKRQLEEYRQQHPDAEVPQKQSYSEKYIAEFLPPLPEPEPEPTPVVPEVPVKPVISREEEVVKAEEATTQKQQAKVEATPPERVEPITPTKPETPSAKAERPESSETPQKGRTLEPQPSKQAGASASPGAVGGETVVEATLNRKHEWESTVKKASNRSWEKVYVLLAGRSLAFYKDQKHAKADPKTYHRHEPPADLSGSNVAAATDYVKRPNVFRLKLPTGGEYLFQCKDEAEMNDWVSKIKAVAGEEAASPSGYKTLPPSLEGRRDEPKRRSFFTLSKKKEKET